MYFSWRTHFIILIFCQFQASVNTSDTTTDETYETTDIFDTTILYETSPSDFDTTVEIITDTFPTTIIYETAWTDIDTTVETSETTTDSSPSSSSVATTAGETSTTTIAPLMECQNGGTPIGKGCYCPPNFKGTVCQYIQIVITGEIERTATAEIEINKEYNSEYNDSGSADYKLFVGNFRNQIVPYYHAKIPKFVNITVVELSAGETFTGRKQRIRIKKEKLTSGSVNVKHDIVVKLEIDNPNEDYDKVYQNIEEAVYSMINCSLTISVCPDFTVNKVMVNKTELSETEYCLLVTESLPEEYRKYFTPAIVQGKLTCVTSCHPDHPDPRTCTNRGTCEVSKQGPACYCLQSNENWYLGKDCEYQIHKVGFYVGISLVAVVLVLSVAGLSANILLNKRKQKRNKDSKEALVNQWIDDDFEWPSQKRSNTIHLVDGYDNPAQSNENFITKTTTPYRTASSTQPPSHDFDLPQNGISLQYLRKNHSMKLNPPQTYSSSRQQTYNSDV